MSWVTVQEVRDFTNIQTSEYGDLQMQALIDRVEQSVKERLGYDPSVNTNTVTEYVDGYETYLVNVSKSPVVSITSVEIFSNSSWSSVDVSNFEIVGETTIKRKDAPFPDGKRNIKITYTVGYSTVPAWIKDYVLLSVAHRLNPENYNEELLRLEQNFAEVGTI